MSLNDWLRHLDRYSPESSPDGGESTIWLPGVKKWPVPSGEARSTGTAVPEGEPQLLAWTIEASLLLEPVDALDYLLRLPHDDQPQRGFIVGGDLRFWQQVGLLAMNCLIEQRYIPALEQPSNRLMAFWQPRLDGDHLKQLADAMPPICRTCVSHPDQAQPPLDLIEDFLNATVDSFIREAYQGKREPSSRWLKALTGKNRQVGGAAKENRQLYEAWQQWRGVSLDEALGNLQVCFRLEEPEVDDQGWYLAYLLRAADDPGLLIEAETVWSSSRRTLRVMERHFDNPQEKLLAALGLASRLFPPIERSLRGSQPVGVTLTHDEVYQFLTEIQPLLESNRFAVMVPDWWKRAARLKARVKLEAQEAGSSGLLNFDSLVRYRWEISLGGETISRDEFEELVALKQPMVRFKGQWITLDPAQVEAALQFFENDGGEGELGMLDALRLTADDSQATVEGLEVEAVDVSGWLNDLLAGLRDPALLELPSIPENLDATLRPYQQRGFGWLVQMRRVGLGACLADDMGLGKTLQTITLWLHERSGNGVKPPALVVCPTSVVGNWRHEINRFAPSLRVMVHHGPDRLQADAFAEEARKYDVVLTSYALLSRDRETLTGLIWAEVVLDEAQNIKNPSTKQTQAARALKADHRIALTGTPVENRLGELWSIIQFLNPGYLGSRQAFRSQFGIPIERYGDQEMASTLRRLVAPIILRRVKTDPTVIADLPEKFENKTYCTLTSEQATLYEAVVREELELLQAAEDDMSRRGAVLRMLTRLKQVCNHPAHFLKESGGQLAGRSGKLARLVEMLEEVIDRGERALIFTQYAEMGSLLQPHLASAFGAEVLYLHGGTPAKKRQEMIEKFQLDYGPPVFILSLKAGGTGLNLTSANHVFHYDRWYNPAVENQATDRAFRIGQTKDVQVHKFICLGTLEERIDELIERKLALAESVVGVGENWLTEMSTADLRDLVSLRREVVEEG
jgi:SNF2 family DNA or RNA helicase